MSNLLSDGDLCDGNVPTPEAPYEDIVTFAYTFDGYAYWGREECANIANARDHSSLAHIRACLFFEMRRWRHFSEEPTRDAEAYHRALVSMIRDRVCGALSTSCGSTSKRLAIAGVSERDVDLLLLEEFQSSPDFSAWFVNEALGTDVHLGIFKESRRSVTGSTGESDLEVTFDDRGRIARLLIENKVNAGLQPMQAERYLRRGGDYVSQGQCSSFHTVIVAPARYFGSSSGCKGFHAKITYERLLIWFRQAEQLGERRNYKIALLQSAIDKGTIGWQPVEDAPVTSFWGAYWTLAFERAPNLEMPRPDKKPSGSTFVHFRPPALPAGVDIVHKLGAGYVDLHLRGLGDRLNEVRAVVGPYLEPEMEVAKATKSVAIRVKVDRLNVALPFESQKDLAVKGLDAATRLLAWYLRCGPWNFRSGPRA